MMKSFNRSSTHSSCSDAVFGHRLPRLDYLRCWDVAGVDSLRLTQQLFGHAVNRLAPLHSVDGFLAHSEQPACTILRLCENNFRLVAYSPCAELAQALQQHRPHHPRAWVKEFNWLQAIVIPEALGLQRLPIIAQPKPPHRLQRLAVDRAILARIHTISVLIWRHAVLGQPVFELQTAARHVETVQRHIWEDSNS
jgi:hypothetical protein